MARRRKVVDQNKDLRDILKEFKKLPKSLDMLAKYATDNTCECKQLVIANVQLASINSGIQSLIKVMKAGLSKPNVTPPGSNTNVVTPPAPGKEVDDNASLLSKMDAQLRKENGDPFERMQNPFPENTDPNFQGPPISPELRAQAQAYTDLANATTAVKEKFFGMVATLTSVQNTVMGVLKDFEGVRKRAYASNSTVAQNTTPQSMNAVADLGVSLKDLTLEVIKLREVGFTELKGSTMKLIARMKLSDQNTASLSTYLVKTSAALGRSEAETQEMAVQLDKTARSFGRRTDDLLNFAASLQESLKILSFGDKKQGAKFEGAATKVEAMTGGKATKEIQQLMAMISDPNNLMKFQAAGMGDPLARMQQAKSKDEAAKVLAQIAKELQTYGKERGAVGAGSGGSAGRQQAMTAVSPVGFDTVLLGNTIAEALEEPQEISPLIESMENLGTIMNRFMAPIERVVNSLFEVMNILSPALGFLANVAGEIAALVMAVVALQGVMKLVQLSSLALQFAIDKNTWAQIKQSITAPFKSFGGAVSNMTQAGGGGIGGFVKGFFSFLRGGFTGFFKLFSGGLLKGVINVASLIGKGLGALMKGILGPIGLILTAIELVSWLWGGGGDKDETKEKLDDIKENTDPKNDPSYKRLNESIAGNVNDVLKNIIEGSANEERLSEMRKQTQLLYALNSNLNTQGKAPTISMRPTR